jgi:prepilin peptidase CpaA
MLQTLSLVMLPVLMIVAALNDVASLRIPNWLTGLTAALFFPMAFLTGMPIAEFGWHLLAGAILFFVGYAIFAVGFFGGGDAKLMAAAGLWFGTSQTMPFLIITVMAGGAMALAYGLWSITVMMLDFHVGDKADGTPRGFVTRLKKAMPQLPYGFALAVGAIVAFPQTWWMNGPWLS